MPVMAVTYTAAADREARVRARPLARRGAIIAPLELLLVGASVFACVLLLATYAGIVRLPRGESLNGAPVNLNGAVDAQRLDPVLATVFPLAADRRLAVRALLDSFSRTDGSRVQLQNVGAIARARVPATTIDRAASAALFRERLAQERERAKASGRDAPESVPLLTGTQLSSIKPSFVVRNLAEVRQSLIVSFVLYIAMFQAVSIFWRIRGLRGDRVLLIAAHLLTGVGLAAMRRLDGPKSAAYGHDPLSPLGASIAVFSAPLKRIARRKCAPCLAAGCRLLAAGSMGSRTGCFTKSTGAAMQAARAKGASAGRRWGWGPSAK